MHAWGSNFAGLRRKIYHLLKPDCPASSSNRRAHSTFHCCIIASQAGETERCLLDHIHAHGTLPRGACVLLPSTCA
jgi:hypothetical protein